MYYIIFHASERGIKKFMLNKEVFFFIFKEAKSIYLAESEVIERKT